MNFRITYDGAPHFCAQCGNPYTRYSPHGLYCSTACKMKAYRQRKQNEVTTKSKKSKPAETRTIAPRCAHCGAAFSRKSAKKMYCSDSCKVMANREKQRMTLGQLALKYNMRQHEAEAWVDERGWKAAYVDLQSGGLVWLENHEMWIPENAVDLWGNEPQRRGKKS